MTNSGSLAREFNFACHSTGATVLQLSTFPSHPHLLKRNQSVTACVAPTSISSRALNTVSTFDTRAIGNSALPTASARFPSSIHIYQAQVVGVSLVLRYWHSDLNFGFYRLHCYWTSIVANPSLLPNPPTPDICAPILRLFLLYHIYYFEQLGASDQK